MNPGEIPNTPEHNKKVHFLYTCTQTFNTVTLYTFVHKPLILSPCTQLYTNL